MQSALLVQQVTNSWKSAQNSVGIQTLLDVSIQPRATITRSSSVSAGGARSTEDCPERCAPKMGIQSTALANDNQPANVFPPPTGASTRTDSDIAQTAQNE